MLTWVRQCLCIFRMVQTVKDSFYLNTYFFVGGCHQNKIVIYVKHLIQMIKQDK